MVEFLPLNFSSSNWLPFHQFQLDKKPLHIKMKSVKEAVVNVLLSITTRDAVTGEEQLESLNAKGKITKMIDRYVVAVKKEGIIVGDLPQ